MRLMTGISVLFYLACAAALLSAFWKNGPKLQLNSFTAPPARNFLLSGLGTGLITYLVAGSFHLEIASGLPYFLGGLLGYWALALLNPTAGARGILLLLISFALTNSATDANALVLPLVSGMAGLTLGRLLLPTPQWTDYALPATWLIGLYWITVSSPESLLQPYQSLLAIFMAISLLLSALQNLPILPEKPALARPTFVLVTGSLGAWLAIQSWLLKPAFLVWVGLFAGGCLLSFLLRDQSKPAEEDANEPFPTVIQGAIQLVLIGIAALVASRLFGTLGWLVIATGLLANRKTSQAAAVAALFFLGRAWLQGFLYQYNPNLTGINITHPYASAALYAGFAVMLLLPTLLNRLWPTIETGSSLATTDVAAPPALPMAWICLTLGAIATGGLANYFLHAEATGSLLVSLTVAGLGVGLLRAYTQTAAATYPMLLSIAATTGALLGQELITLGNEAEKTEKLIVLGIALAIAGAGLFLSSRGSSRRKPVAIP